MLAPDKGAVWSIITKNNQELIVGTPLIRALFYDCDIMRRPLGVRKSYRHLPRESTVKGYPDRRRHSRARKWLVTVSEIRHFPV